MKSAILALALTQSATPEIDFGPTIPATNPYVSRVMCESGSGSAFKLKSGKWITARHVSANGGCTIDGRRIYVEHASGDFSILDMGDSPSDGLDINCDGFKDGEWYYGIGYGRGVLQSKAVRYSLLHSLFEPEFSALLVNRFVPGMSGGPVLDSMGRVVGIVNAYGTRAVISYSRALKDTILCGAPHA